MPNTALRPILLLCLTTTLGAQDLAPSPGDWLHARVDIQSATVSLMTLRRTSKASDAVKAEVDKLIQEGAGFMASGNTGETRRRIYHSLSLLGGLPWTPKEEFAAALLLRTDTRVADTARRVMAHLEQIYPATYQPATGWRLHVTLHEMAPSRSGPTPGKLLRDEGIVEGLTRDFIDEPAAFDVDLACCGEGVRVLAAELLDGEQPVRKLWVAIHVVNGLDAKRQETEARLQKLSGHESAKASVMAPYDLARMMNLGRREFARVDFSGELRQSEELLRALEAGRDPLTQAVGNHKRHYYFADAGEIMPYRVYVPTTYKPGAHLPLVVVLHGLGGNEDTFLGRSGGQMASLAEKHGFVVAAPLGYRINGNYGSGIRRNADAARMRTWALSEKDVMNVLKLVSDEYGTYPQRTFLMGHSMGGSGTWFLGQKYAEKWAAIAPIAGPSSDAATYPWDRLKGMPVIVCHGDADATVPVESSRNMVAAMKQRGMTPVYVEVPGASHGSVVEVAVPKILDFFAEHSRATEPRP